MAVLVRLVISALDWESQIGNLGFQRGAAKANRLGTPYTARGQAADATRVRIAQAKACDYRAEA